MWPNSPQGGRLVSERRFPHGPGKDREIYRQAAQGERLYASRPGRALGGHRPGGLQVGAWPLPARRRADAPLVSAAGHHRQRAPDRGRGRYGRLQSQSGTKPAGAPPPGGGEQPGAPPAGDGHRLFGHGGGGGAHPGRRPGGGGLALAGGTHRRRGGHRGGGHRLCPVHRARRRLLPVPPLREGLCAHPKERWSWPRTWGAAGRCAAPTAARRATTKKSSPKNRKRESLRALPFAVVCVIAAPGGRLPGRRGAALSRRRTG